MKLTEAQKKELLKNPKIKKLHAQWKKLKGGSKMRGGDFWGDVGRWFNKAGQDVGNWVKTAAKDADKWLKETKAASKVLTGLTTVAPFLGMPEVSAVSGPAAKFVADLGYGKRKRGGEEPKINWNAFGDMLKGAYPILAPAFLGSGCCGGLSINPPGQRLGQGRKGKGYTGDYLKKPFLEMTQDELDKIKADAVKWINDNKKGIQRPPVELIPRMPVLGAGKKKGGMVSAMPRDALGAAGMMGKGRRRKGKGVGEFNTISSSFGQISV